MRPSIQSLRQFVVSPSAFFAERPPADSLKTAFGLVVLFSLCLTVAFFLLGFILAGTIDGTIAIDNPDRPPAMICDTHQDATTLNCDEPETVDRDGGELIQEAVYDRIWMPIVGPFFIWILGGIALFTAGRLGGGRPSFDGALSLAGWATIPEFVRLAAGLVGLQVVLRNVTVSDLDGVESVVVPAIESVHPILTVVSLLVAGWQWHLLSGGLSAEADISKAAAAVGVAIPLGLLMLTVL